MLSRRGLVLALLAARGTGAALAAGSASSAPALVFPRDFGAHPESQIEWWYITGALAAAARTWGFQITFFRAATGIAGAEGSAFRADQLLFAHAAVTDLANRRLLHDQRLARSGFGIAAASTTDTALCCAAGARARAIAADRSRYRAHAASETAGFRFDLELATTQPVLLQGDQAGRARARRARSSAATTASRSSPRAAR
jgi:predicted secreted hydrolase